MKRTLDGPSEKLACPLCASTYRRRDVLRRHIQTCGQRGGGAYQPPIRGKPGRKRKSCNACAAARLFCDGELPCEACLQKGLDCSFSRTQEQSPRSSQFIQLPPHQRPEDTNPPREANPDNRPVKLSIPFLLHYTDVENESKYESLRLLSQCTGADPKVGCCAVNHQPNNLNFFTDSWEKLFNSFIHTANLDPPCNLRTSAPYSFELDDLESTSAELLAVLAGYGQDAQGQASLDITRARQTFIPSNIAKFIGAFLDNPFHTHYINPAAFSLSKSSKLLVLTMVLLGAVYSNPDHSDDLAAYSNVTEHLVFEGPAFKELLLGQPDSLDSRSTLESLQAAMLVITLQSYKENPDSIRRIRLQRMPTVFTAIRMLQLNRITNDCTPGVLDWDTYLLREGLVRVMVGIYLLDCYCVIFFRYPTLLRLDEIAFEIPQRDDLFHARSAAEWEQLCLKYPTSHAPLRLRTVLRDFMRPEGQPPQHSDYFPNTIFGSFLVLSAIQCVLFDLLALHTFMDDIRVFEPVERALDRWKIHWDSLCEGIRPATAKRAGFIIHAAEFWCVAKALVRHPSTAWPEDSKDTLDTTQSFRRLVDRLMGDSDSDSATFV
ncbi:hypothetical protein ASPBRDRAFT_50948 [Aspergillus brasiliensis CBS 101740]|uniref:Zn(2)-C6 fungal-type domain-containing protein n=1 Tax=Aspergillus brasiliensis (strain CBS 101740 / IMI 381727 / IBT 21946) TaxID=767769 RepID=A0A1L9V2J5_ASPBC|nr:hypothetical protein ASPBRDRAFT_50948 [Aspergillus brasiliensis CBS 101740]